VVDDEPLGFEDAEVRMARLEQRVVSLTEELERRIAEADRMKGFEDKARELDALLATKTMRFLAVPRRFYKRVRSSMPQGEP
jgi:hypothetical protein